MRVGIFGDSFAHIPPTKHQKNLTLAWPEYISQKYKTDCYGHPGTSLLYSVNKIKENHHNYDKIILTVTNPDRFEFNSLVQDYCDQIVDQFNFDYLRRVQGLSSVESMLTLIEEKHSDYHLVKNAWTAAYNYFLYIYDQKSSEYLHSLMIDDLIRFRNDIILIPCFSNSFGTKRIKDSLFEIQQKENDHWGISNETNSFNDIRYCHLTAENNEIFANNVLKWLDGEPVNINLDDYSLPSEPISRYFI